MSQILVIARVRDLGSRLQCCTPLPIFLCLSLPGVGGGGKSDSIEKVMSCLKGHCHYDFAV